MASKPSSGLQPRQQISYKSGIATSTSSSDSSVCQSIPIGNYYRGLNDGPLGRVIFSTVCSPDSRSTLSELKHDTGLSVEWSVDEQYKLEKGLAKYANEPSILQYIKIAASLRDKTVRDVALRCSWMARKRRKQEDQSLGKKERGQKEKLTESSLKNSISSASSVNMGPYSLSRDLHDQSGGRLSEVPGWTTRHLLEENGQALCQISANLSALKLMQNIDLFFHLRNNITTILNDMRYMPGIMSQMPPLPVFLNEELASIIFPLSSQPMLFSSSSVIPLKPEPGC